MFLTSLVNNGGPRIPWALIVARESPSTTINFYALYLGSLVISTSAGDKRDPYASPRPTGKVNKPRTSHFARTL